MSDLNRATILGRLGKDPEVRYTQDNTPVATLSIATSEKWTDKQTGEKHENTEWHRVIAWRGLAEVCQRFLAKGRQVYIEGKLTTRKWQDKQGQDRYTTEITAQNIILIGDKGSAAGQQQPPAGTYAAPHGGYQQPNAYQQPAQGDMYGGAYTKPTGQAPSGTASAGSFQAPPFQQGPVEDDDLPF